MKRHKMATLIDVFTGKDGRFYFRAVAGSRQVGTVSEAYTRRSSAIRGAMRWHPGVTIHVLENTERRTKDGRWIPAGRIVTRVIS